MRDELLFPYISRELKACEAIFGAPSIPTFLSLICGCPQNGKSAFSARLISAAAVRGMVEFRAHTQYEFLRSGL